MVFHVILIVVFLFSLSFSQVNTWIKSPNNEIGQRNYGSLVFCPDSGRFLLSLGSVTRSDTNPYAEMVYLRNQSRWINFLPDNSLYGIWADSTGNAYGRGTNEHSIFGSYYFIFKGIPEAGTIYLRPNIRPTMTPAAYFQFAYNPNDRTIYYYANNWTISYNTATRRWDTLSPPVHPAGSEGGNSRLMWGSMCYDPVNQEVVLFSGGSVELENGRPGTWTYSPGGNTWTRLNLTVQPPARAYSQMVYDAKNQVIVLFGGDHLDYMHADTWVYDCASRTWAQKSPSRSPSPRAGHLMLYLPKSQRIVLIGGFEYTHCTGYMCSHYREIRPQEMWTYDPLQDEWAFIKAFDDTATTPYFCVTGKSLSGMAAADTGDFIVAIGNEIASRYSFNQKTYTMQCDPAQVDAAGTLTYGVTPGTVMTQPGPFDPAWYDQDVDPVDTAANEDFLASISNDTWVDVSAPKVPKQNRDWGTTAYDPERDLFLKWSGGHSAHSGTDVPHYSPNTNRWHIGYAPEWMLEWNYASGFRPPHYTFNNRPFMTGHTYDNYDYDLNLHKMILVKTKYTYTYNPDNMDWDSLRLSNHPDMGGHYYRTSVTSSKHGAFCWTHRTGSNSQFYFYLFDADSMQWRKLNINGESTVPVYYCEDGGAAYDSKRDRMILTSKGTDAGAVWTYDFATSTLAKLAPSGTPPPNHRREAVYVLGKDIMFVQDDYAYDCQNNSWQHLSIAKGSGVGSVTGVSAGMMYDLKRGLVWFCGTNCETYALKLTGAVASVEDGDNEGSQVFSVSPNPFNPVTTIVVRYKVKGKRHTPDLRIYNINGKIVKDFSSSIYLLPSTSYLPKTQSLVWNASHLPSGLYFIKLKYGEKSLTKKITLIR